MEVTTEKVAAVRQSCQARVRVFEEAQQYGQDDISEKFAAMQASLDMAIYLGIISHADWQTWTEQYHVETIAA